MISAAKRPTWMYSTDDIDVYYSNTLWHMRSLVSKSAPQLFAVQTRSRYDCTVDLDGSCGTPRSYGGQYTRQYMLNVAFYA